MVCKPLEQKASVLLLRAADCKRLGLQLAPVQITHSLVVIGLISTSVLAPHHDTARCYSCILTRTFGLCWHPVC